MKTFKIQWWDGMMVVTAVVAGLLVVQYAVSRGSAPALLEQPVRVKIRVPHGLNEVAVQIKSGDLVLDQHGGVAGTVLSTRQMGAGPEQGLIPGEPAWLVEVQVERSLPCMRDLPGFDRQPAAMKAGAWCLLETKHAAVSGMIIDVVEARTP